MGYDVIIAGGLNPDNVDQALTDVGDLPPWGVDVATGVEGADYRKDPALMKAFVAAVRRHEEAVEAEAQETE
jgi:phosphoribosylanthranilate isomerase